MSKAKQQQRFDFSDEDIRHAEKKIDFRDCMRVSDGEKLALQCPRIDRQLKVAIPEIEAEELIIEQQEINQVPQRKKNMFIRLLQAVSKKLS